MRERLREWFYDRYGFWLFRTNWHRLPFVRRLLCAIGRHDYEFDGLKEYDNRPPSGRLVCFECERVKHSRPTSH